MIKFDLNSKPNENVLYVQVFLHFMDAFICIILVIIIFYRSDHFVDYFIKAQGKTSKQNKTNLQKIQILLKSPVMLDINSKFLDLYNSDISTVEPMRANNHCDNGISCPPFQSCNSVSDHGQQTTNKPVNEWYEDVENVQGCDWSDSKFNIFRGLNDYKGPLQNAKCSNKSSILTESSDLEQLNIQEHQVVLQISQRESDHRHMKRIFFNVRLMRRLRDLDSLIYVIYVCIQGNQNIITIIFQLAATNEPSSPVLQQKSLIEPFWDLFREKVPVWKYKNYLKPIRIKSNLKRPMKYFLEDCKHFRLKKGKIILEECWICLLRFKREESMTLLYCCHRFHTNCMVKWLRSSGSCPVCRESLEDNYVRRIKLSRMKNPYSISF